MPSDLALWSAAIEENMESCIGVALHCLSKLGLDQRSQLDRDIRVVLSSSYLLLFGLLGFLSLPSPHQLSHLAFTLHT